VGTFGGGGTGSAWWKSMMGIRDWMGLGVGSCFDDNILGKVGDGSSTFF